MADHQGSTQGFGAQPTEPTQPTQPTQPAQSTQPIYGTVNQARPVPSEGQPQQSYGTYYQQGAAQGGAYGYQQPTAQQRPVGAHATHAPHMASPSQGGPVGFSAPRDGTASKNNSGGKTFLLAFAGALLACVLAFGVNGVVSSYNAPTPADNITPSLGATTNSGVDVSEDATLAEAVSAKCLPSVAAIDVYARQQSSPDGLAELYEYFGFDFGFGDQGQGQGGSGELVAASLGSGVVLSEDGYIVTNYHVVEGGEAYEVTIGGKTYEAELIGSDPSSDVAVLKAKDATGLTPMEIGDSDDLVIGEWVMSIGSPFGLEQSVATGIVSATSRSQIMDTSSMTGNATGDVTIYPNMIQTDAAINPGNSGGALVDADGRLIGINTLITSYSGNYSGVGFAIPVNYAINLAQQIIDGQNPTHAQLGVSLSTVNDQMAQRYGLSSTSGAYVAAVSPDSGAAQAGIQEGDIITAFDGKAVESASDLMLDVRSKMPGDTVSITVNRNGQAQDLQVTLGSDGE